MRNAFKVGNLLIPRAESKFDDNLLILSYIGDPSLIGDSVWEIVDSLTGKTYYADESTLLMSYEIVECHPPANNHKSE